MPNERGARRAGQTEIADREPGKRELQRQMRQTRESLAETVGEIKEKVEHEYLAAKQTVSGVLDYREQFKNEPLVWSLGALSAGFALGYTVGQAHKNAKGRKQSPLLSFADGMVDELSTMGQSLVMPALNLKIRELFGFDFSQFLNEMSDSQKRGGSKKTSSKRRSSSKGRALKAGIKKRGSKKAGS